MKRLCLRIPLQQLLVGFVFFLSMVDSWGNQFVTIQLNHGISVDLPRDWGYADESGRQLLLTHAESVERVSGFQSSGEFELLIFAKYGDSSSYASATITVSSPSLSSEYIGSWSNAKLMSYGDSLQKDFEQSYPAQGNRIVEWMGTQKVVIRGVNAIQTRWRRALQSNPTVYVEQTQIPRKDQLINVTLSYREKDKAVFEPIIRAIYMSITF